MPSPSMPNDYPIELEAPDLSPYAAGNAGIPYAWSFDAAVPGPHVMLTALVHGNELCGALALDWLMKRQVRPARGRLSLVFVNIAAYEAFDPADPSASRYIDEDFNRLWTAEVLDGPRRSSELTRARELRGLFDGVDMLFDIHSMQQPSPPFMMAGPLDKGRELAAEIGVPEIVIMDAGHKAGRRLRDYQGFGDPNSPKNAVLIECGQHWEAAAETLAIDASLRFLRATGTTEAGFGGDRARETPPAQTVVEVTEAVTIESDEGFTFARPFSGGETLEKAGTLIGHDGSRPVVAPYDGCFLVMPSKRLFKGQTAVRLGRRVS